VEVPDTLRSIKIFTIKITKTKNIMELNEGINKLAKKPSKS
jgi:hypothetical protein